jgi:hypothetical protein
LSRPAGQPRSPQARPRRFYALLTAGLLAGILVAGAAMVGIRAAVDAIGTSWVEGDGARGVLLGAALAVLAYAPLLVALGTRRRRFTAAFAGWAILLTVAVAAPARVGGNARYELYVARTEHAPYWMLGALAVVVGGVLLWRSTRRSGGGA